MFHVKHFGLPKSRSQAYGKIVRSVRAVKSFHFSVLAAQEKALHEVCPKRIFGHTGRRTPLLFGILFAENRAVANVQYARGTRADKIAAVGAGQKRLRAANARNQAAAAIGIQFAEHIVQQ